MSESQQQQREGIALALNSDFLNSLIDQIVKVCYYANKQYSYVIGDFSFPEYENANPEVLNSMRQGVIARLSNPNISDEENHNQWMKQRMSEGWSYGEVKDEDLKTHPYLLEYSKLPPQVRAKDAIFGSITLAMISEYFEI